MSRKMMLIEDNPENRLVICDIIDFDRVDVELEQFGTAEQALARIADIQPILVMMDIALPGMNGIEAARVLKSNPQTRSIPIWVVSAHAMPDDRELAMRVGCDAYFTKPIDTRAFACRLRALVETRKEAA
ncbi:MAG: response regulator [Planctomycetes bacterium]|nr:response regulator [Planctomycetota bacterium]